jgi:type I restriction enzyme M protein
MTTDRAKIFDYPVFTAAPDAVGITSTGAEGPNRLPEVLKAYRRFEEWVAQGANPEQVPVFETE